MAQPYYVVWNPITGYTKYKHDTRQAAENEAKRLALEHRGQSFVVLAPISMMKIAEVQTTLFEYDEIPF